MRPLFVIGTRPEAIKLAPVIAECRRRGDALAAVVCTTGQHDEMLDQALEDFGIQSDEKLALMTPRQELADFASRCLAGVDQALARLRPHGVVVQGDTTSALAAGLAAFYRRIPLLHVEAGLRTGNLQSPWPEELHRRVITLAAAVHCAPTPRAAEALRSEGVPASRVHLTGNPVVDALLSTCSRLRCEAPSWTARFQFLGVRPMVLVTAHRRESFGDGLEAIGQAVARLAERFADHAFVYPLHLNPQVRQPMERLLSGHPNVHLLPPASYPEFVWLMSRSILILTDSGGIQEEAPSLRKPVLVMRDVTERPEAVAAGAARVVGTSYESIVENTAQLLTDPDAYAACQADHNPYGDGRAAARIVDLMLAQETCPPLPITPSPPLRQTVSR